MKKILLVSHGTMAKGMYDASRMIIGDCQDVDYVCLSCDKDVEMIKKEFEAKKTWLSECDTLIVLADLLGGSPCTTCIHFLQENSLFEKSRIIAGMNLPLLMSIILNPNIEDSNQLDMVINESKESLSLFKVIEDDDEL